MALQQRDARHYRYTDYLGWPDDVRYELIDGVAIDWQHVLESLTPSP